MDKNHSIVFVTGASLSDVHSEPLRPYLETAGYNFVPVTLPSARIREPRATYEGDVQAITQALESVQSPDITLILHSYSGIPGREAANRYLASNAKQLKRIMFIAALDKFNPAVDHFFYDDDVVRYEDGYNYLLDPAKSAFSDLTMEQAKPFVDAVEPQTLPLPTETDFWGPYASEDWRRLDRVYMICLNDRLVLQEYEEQQAKRVEGESVRRKWDHCPMASHPEELAEVIKGYLHSYDCKVVA